MSTVQRPVLSLVTMYRLTSLLVQEEVVASLRARVVAAVVLHSSFQSAE